MHTHDADPRREHGYFLLEVLVALAVLAGALLGIAQVLGAAVRSAGTARHASAALVAAAAVAETAVAGVEYPPGWRPVGEIGPDGLPATADDSAPNPRTDLPCWRRVVVRDDGAMRWFWIEATCGSAPGSSGVPFPAGPGRMRRVRLVVGR